MKMKNLASVFGIVAAAALALLAPTAQADHVRTSTVLALQDDLNYLDDSVAQLNTQQRARFQPRLDAIRADLTNLRSRMNDPATWRTHVTQKEIDDMRVRIAAVQSDVDRASARASARANARTGAYGRELPAGTEVDVRLDQTVSSKTARVEDRVEGTVVTPVVVNGRTVVPSGTVVTGHVAEVDDADRGGRDGRVRLDFTGMQFPNGTRADIRSQVVRVDDRHTGTSTTRRGALGAILGGVLGGIIEGKSGALIGAILGGGGAIVATRGQNVELPEGTHLVLRLDQATVLAMRE
jgi:hypothetical protein